MNQEKLKEILIELYPSSIPFTVLFSGKESKRVNGLYQVFKREIIIHNKNFKSDNQLIYTAIHEYTHHLIEQQIVDNKIKRTAKIHSVEFWSLFHELLEKAENKGIYQLNTNKKLESLIETAKEIQQQINLLEDKLANILVEINKEAKTDSNVRIEDIFTRQLRIPKTTVNSYIQTQNDNVPTEFKKTIASLKTGEERENITNLIHEGKSIEQIKVAVKNLKGENKHAKKDAKTGLQPDQNIEKLHKEAKRIEKTIYNLNLRLDFIKDILADEGLRVG